MVPHFIYFLKTRFLMGRRRISGSQVSAGDQFTHQWKPAKQGQAMLRGRVQNESATKDFPLFQDDILQVV